MYCLALIYVGVTVSMYCVSSNRGPGLPYSRLLSWGANFRYFCGYPRVTKFRTTNIYTLVIHVRNTRNRATKFRTTNITSKGSFKLFTKFYTPENNHYTVFPSRLFRPGLYTGPASIYARTVGVKKVHIYRPYNGMGNSIPFLFNFHAVAVLVRFQTVPVLSQGQPVRSGERPRRCN